MGAPLRRKVALQGRSLSEQVSEGARCKARSRCWEHSDRARTGRRRRLRGSWDGEAGESGGWVGEEPEGRTRRDGQHFAACGAILSHQISLIGSPALHRSQQAVPYMAMGWYGTQQVRDGTGGLVWDGTGGGSGRDGWHGMGHVRG